MYTGMPCSLSLGPNTLSLLTEFVFLTECVLPHLDMQYTRLTPQNVPECTCLAVALLAVEQFWWSVYLHIMWKWHAVVQ